MITKAQKTYETHSFPIFLITFTSFTQRRTKFTTTAVWISTGSEVSSHYLMDLQGSGGPLWEKETLILIRTTEKTNSTAGFLLQKCDFLMIYMLSWVLTCTHVHISRLGTGRHCCCVVEVGWKRSQSNDSTFKKCWFLQPNKKPL